VTILETQEHSWRFPLLGLDISATRIGLAIADNSLSPPRPLFTYLRITRAQDLARIVAWVERYQIGAVVMGLPVNMDGTPGERARWMGRLARELRQCMDIPIHLQDERLSTVEAEELLHARGLSHNQVSEEVDAVAAALILERFLREQHHGNIDS